MTKTQTGKALTITQSILVYKQQQAVRCVARCSPGGLLASEEDQQAMVEAGGVVQAGLRPSSVALGI